MKTKPTRRKLPVKRAAAPKKKVQPIPAGYSAVTPYLALRGAAQAIEFYRKAFGAKEILRMPGPEGKIGHLWHVATRKEKLTMAEVKRRAERMSKQGSA